MVIAHDCFDRAIDPRTRFIVKRANTDPLRYTVKIASEKNTAPIKSLKDDESFEMWGRILNDYCWLETRLSLPETRPRPRRVFRPGAAEPRAGGAPARSTRAAPCR